MYIFLCALCSLTPSCVLGCVTIQNTGETHQGPSAHCSPNVLHVVGFPVDLMFSPTLKFGPYLAQQKMPSGVVLHALPMHSLLKHPDDEPNEFNCLV